MENDKKIQKEMRKKNKVRIQSHVILQVNS